MDRKEFDNMYIIMDADRKIKPAAILSLTGIYVVANFFMLLNRGFWWDGLRLITNIDGKNMTGVWTHLGQYQSYLLYYIIKGIVFLGGNTAFLLKLSAFLVWLGSALVLYVILRKYLSLPDRDSFFISAYFILFPSFPFKGELGYLHFSAGILLFLTGILVFLASERYSGKFSRYWRLSAAAILFFGSFWNRALLVFYGGFLLLLLYRSYLKHRSSADSSLWQLVRGWVKSNYFYILLPILFWLFHGYLGKGHGEGGMGYTEFVFLNPGFLNSLIDNAWSFVAYGLGWPLIAPLAILDRRLFFVLFAALFFVFYICAKKILLFSRNDDTQPSPTPLHYLSLGALWFFVGIIPYLAIGVFLSVYGDGFHMRYAILIPLGAAFLIHAAVLALIRERWRLGIQIAVIALFSTYSVFNCFMLDMDWYRQEAITLSLKETTSDAIQKASTLVFYDDFREMRFLGRNIKSGEYIMYAYRAYYPENFKSALAMNVGDIGLDETIPVAVQKHYDRFVRFGAFPVPKDFNPLANILPVTVLSRKGEELMTVAQWLSLKKAEVFSGKETFNDALRNHLKIEVVPFVPSKIDIEDLR